MDGLKQRMAEAVRRQPQSTVTVLSSLLALQDELGYIPKEGVEEVAEFTDSTVNDVWAVASFYPNFRFTPPCLHQVEVCWGASCHLVGAMPVIEAALDSCGLTDEGDTPDGTPFPAFQYLPGGLLPSPGDGYRPSLGGAGHGADGQEQDKRVAALANGGRSGWGA